MEARPPSFVKREDHWGHSGGTGFAPTELLYLLPRCVLATQPKLFSPVLLFRLTLSVFITFGRSLQLQRQVPWAWLFEVMTRSPRRVGGRGSTRAPGGAAPSLQRVGPGPGPTGAAAGGGAGEEGW